MRKQIARGVTMLMLVVGLAFASAAVANGQSRQLTAQVPFDFIVADKTLHSGQYRVRREGVAGEVITVRSRDEKDQLFRITTNAGSARDMRARLVFHRYGGSYYLSQVWIDGSGRQLPATKQERAAERELKQLAAYRGDNQAVYEVVELIAVPD